MHKQVPMKHMSQSKACIKKQEKKRTSNSQKTQTQQDSFLHQDKNSNNKLPQTTAVLIKYVCTKPPLNPVNI